MVAIIRAEKDWTAAARLATLAVNGKLGRQTGGSWLDDLSELKKSVVLCDTHARKFVDKNYYRHEFYPYVAGACDYCGEEFSNCILYLHKRQAREAWIIRERYERLRNRGVFD